MRCLQDCRHRLGEEQMNGNPRSSSDGLPRESGSHFSMTQKECATGNSLNVQQKVTPFAIGYSVTYCKTTAS